MNNIKGFFNAFVFAPLIPAVIFAIETPLFEGFISKIGAIIIFYLISSMVEIFFGLPLFFLLNFFKLFNWWSSLLAGSVVGGIISFLLNYPNQIQILPFLMFVMLGSISSFGFYCIFRYSSRK